MDDFISRKKQRLMSSTDAKEQKPSHGSMTQTEDANESTDLKLATLASLFPAVDHVLLLDILVASEGSVEQACKALTPFSEDSGDSPKRKPRNGIGYQTSLAVFKQAEPGSILQSFHAKRNLTRKGQTLHLYTPENIENHTPCSIIHNFLPPHVAEALLRELLNEAPTFERQRFKMFDNVVQSPHSACFYVENPEEQKAEYLYNGSCLTVGLMDYLY
ncbi:MAG: hypothetical protein Q9170_000756 [Blastenia crenularia]